MFPLGHSISRWLGTALSVGSVVWLVVCIPSFGAFTTQEWAVLDKCYSAKGLCEGRHFDFALVEVLEIEPKAYIVEIGGKRRRIIGDSTVRWVGEIISIKSKFYESELYELHAMLHPRRHQKKTLGLIGLILLLPFVSGLISFMRRKDA